VRSSGVSVRSWPHILQRLFPCGGDADDGEAESACPAGAPDIEEPNGAGVGCVGEAVGEGRDSGWAARELQ